MDYLAIGKRIKEARIKQKLTQMDVAEKADISYSFYGHIERGTRKLSVETLYKLALVLNCSADELLNTGVYDTRGLTVREMLCRVLDMMD